DRKSTRLNSSHMSISYAVFCLKKKNNQPSVLLRASAVSLPGPSSSRHSQRSEHLVFFFNDRATPEIYPLSLHNALPIYVHVARKAVLHRPVDVPLVELAADAHL